MFRGEQSPLWNTPQLHIYTGKTRIYLYNIYQRASSIANAATECTFANDHNIMLLLFWCVSMIAIWNFCSFYMQTTMIKSNWCIATHHQLLIIASCFVLLLLPLRSRDEFGAPATSRWRSHISRSPAVRCITKVHCVAESKRKLRGVKWW